MSTKTYFKRIALVVVASLGFGAMSTATSFAAIPTATASVALSASSGSAIAGETTTAVTVTVQFTPTATTDTVTVLALAPTSATVADAATTGSNLRITTDSSNATIAYTGASGDSKTVTITPTTANAVTRVVLTYTIRAVSTAGTFGYTLQARLGSDQSIIQSALYTLTVSAVDASASATKSNLWLNQAMASGTMYVRTDSTSANLRVSAGQQPDLSLATPVVVAYIAGEFRNAAGDSVNATTGGNVNGTITVKITSGPGFLSKNSAANTNLRQVDIARGDSVSVWSDGASGITEITGYIGTTALTDAPDTLTFYGKATSLVATANAVTTNGWNLSSAVADSVTSGNDVLTFIAKDINGITVPSASQNRNSKFFIHSSDTKVVRATNSATLGYGECTAPSTAADIVAGKWYCDVWVIDSGTVTLTVADSFTVASSLYTANVITVTIAGAPWTGSYSFSKLGSATASTVYNTGENVMLTVTCKDRAGRTCGQPTTTGVAHTAMFTWPAPGDQNKQFIMGASGDNATGTVSTGTATFQTMKTYLASGSTFMGGTETAVVTMPLTEGDVNILVYTNYESSTVKTDLSTTLTINAAAANAAGDKASAAQAAADAATDAALEAIDAANAATDAANLAAEAADAATVAAEEARDAADAATAAVELSQQRWQP